MCLTGVEEGEGQYNPKIDGELYDSSKVGLPET